MGSKLFQWDSGNRYKSLVKHQVTNKEAESCFEIEPSVIYVSGKQNSIEIRYIRVSLSDKGRLITNVFIIRDEYFRIISSRPANAQEKRKYEAAKG